MRNTTPRNILIASSANAAWPVYCIFMSNDNNKYTKIPSRFCIISTSSNVLIHRHMHMASNYNIKKTIKLYKK